MAVHAREANMGNATLTEHAAKLEVLRACGV
jgi:hypothetical protein